MMKKKQLIRRLERWARELEKTSNAWAPAGPSGSLFSPATFATKTVTIDSTRPTKDAKLLRDVVRILKG